MTGLFGSILGAEVVAATLDDRAWLGALCRTEAALAAACAEVGLIDDIAAAQVQAAADELASSDPDELNSIGDGSPVIPLVARLRSAAGPAEAAVHLGATSQDILDTAAMLVCADALDVIIDRLNTAADHAAGLAANHRDTPMVARTLLQQATPTTFGAVAIGWTAGLDAARDRLVLIRQNGLAVQLAGAGGTSAALYPHGPAVRRVLAKELGLLDPNRGWHTERGRICELAAALGTACAAAGTVALDIVLLAQTELAEVAEGAGGGSSAMPHKHNPIAAVTARAAALQAPGLVATLLAAASGHELQRAAGSWHAEWLPLVRLLEATAGAAARLADSLAGLAVNTIRMKANLDAGNGLTVAERVAAAAADRLGKATAQRKVGEASTDPRGFRAALLADPELALTELELDELLDPSGYLGHAPDEVDSYLEDRHR
jgi:3-carboxy-cis,cis-muconate cycloisomerase